ncbi:hypothetical protein NHX12_009584 [Muraenolepis orangiensis]|uniref:Uncharacterized protein n=1 Tax=Muraenolepis orangiensis TaxID=630683 RepID=A0A9Q0I821_9TELE|nr:hypothetical protein NHX12_009584 [Muraenolepis orangiensis]
MLRPSSSGRRLPPGALLLSRRIREQKEEKREIMKTTILAGFPVPRGAAVRMAWGGWHVHKSRESGAHVAELILTESRTVLTPAPSEPSTEQAFRDTEQMSA